MRTFDVIFWNVDPWNAENDRMDSFLTNAENEDQAVSNFRAEYDNNEKSLCSMRGRSMNPKSNSAKSFANLVKYNNGVFKSKAQAKYLLSRCMYLDGFVFTSRGCVSGNAFAVTYHCNSSGVVLVTKTTQTGTIIQWEPKIN